MPTLTPDAWVQIRHDYEHTDRPIEDICAGHGISSGTLRDRMRRWGWARRRPPIPREGPPAVVAPTWTEPQIDATTTNRWRSDEARELPPPAAAPMVARDDQPRAAECETLPVLPLGPRLRGDERENDAPAAIGPRLHSTVARVLPAIEATLAKLAAGLHHPREIEQTARALGTLMRTLRELNAQLSQYGGRAGAAGDSGPADIDDFRDELARRINALVEAHEAGIPARYEAAWLEMAAGAEDE